MAFPLAGQGAEKFGGAATAFKGFACGLPCAFGCDALAVGGVEHQGAACGGRWALQSVSRLEVDGLGDTGTLGVAGGKVGETKTHVARKNRHRRRMDSCFGLRLQLIPNVKVRTKTEHALECKTANQTGCHAAGHLRGFNGDGARATAGVKKRAVFGAALPVGGSQHGSRQGFFQWRFALHVLAPALGVTPSPLEECFARGVGVQRGVIGAEVQRQGQVRVARVDTRAFTAMFTHHVAHGVFDAQGCKVQARER